MAGTPEAIGIIEKTACGYAASWISFNLKGGTKQFGWLQVSATRNYSPQ
jgi:hypothetical protein